MMKAVIYARLSTLGQTEGASLESQVEDCEKYAKANGFTAVKVYREVFSGEDFMYRPELEKVRNEIKAGLYNAIIIHHTDRLTRGGIAHLAILYDEFQRYNTKLISVLDPLEDSDEGELVRSVNAYAAKKERLQIRERTMRGRLKNAKDGTLNYKRKLYGYHLTDSGRVYSDTESPIVRGLFASVLEGHSLRGIASELNRRGTPTPMGSSIWWANSIKSILNNPAYAGRTVAFRFKRETRYAEGRKKINGSVLRDETEWIEIPDITPAIVDQETFDAVQRQLRINQKEKRRPVKHNYLLRGFIRCANCGRAYTPQPSRNSRRYSCSSLQNPSINCHTKSLSADKAEMAVWVKAMEIISKLTIVPPEPKPGPDPLPKIDQQISKLEREMSLIVDRSATADPRTWKMFERQLSQKADEIEVVREHRAAVIKQRASKPKADSLKNIRAMYRKRIQNLSFEEQVTVLKALGTVCTWNGTELKVNIHAR